MSHTLPLTAIEPGPDSSRTFSDSSSRTEPVVNVLSSLKIVLGKVLGDDVGELDKSDRDFGPPITDM